ncbi:MAG: DUF2312 domain-containing protein [Rhodobacter sp.]|nr:DUF2312 domain-containing protein [Rhodobacter sp.]
MTDKETKPAATNMVNGSKLRGYIERLERLEAQKGEASDDIAAVKAEAKAEGFTPKYINAILKLRKKSPSDREEDDAMMDLYTGALGMSRDVPLFRHVQGMGVDTAAQESVVEALKLLVPDSGEITIKVGKSPRMRLHRDNEGVHVEEVSDAPPPPPASAARGTAPRPQAEVPDCTPKQAFELGKQARRDDKPVIDNPFPWDDKRRPKWDEGWREEDGGDGMGPRK